MKIEAKSRLTASPDFAAAMEVMLDSVTRAVGLRGTTKKTNPKMLTWIPAVPSSSVVDQLIKGAKACSFTVPGKEGSTASYKFGDHTFFLTIDTDGSHAVMTYK